MLRPFSATPGGQPDSAGLVLLLPERSEGRRAVQCDKNLCSLFPDPPLPLPNEPGDAGPTAAASAQLAEGRAHGLRPAPGPECLLIKSRPCLEPACPLLPRDATHSPGRGGPLGGGAAHRIRGKQRKAGRHSPSTKARRQQGTGGHIPLHCNKEGPPASPGLGVRSSSLPLGPSVSSSVWRWRFQCLTHPAAMHWCISRA